MLHHPQACAGRDSLHRRGKFDVHTAGGEKVPTALLDNLKEASNCDANDYIIAPFIKIPLGLWVYNNWNDSAKGIKGAIYNWLVKPNVLISEVRPEMRVKLMEQILDNNGYFGSTATYDIAYSKHNDRKAAIDYTLNVSGAISPRFNYLSWRRQQN